jgi:hypothetical protein
MHFEAMDDAIQVADLEETDRTLKFVAVFCLTIAFRFFIFVKVFSNLKEA